MMTKKTEKIHRINGVNVGYSDKKITSYGGFSLLAMFFEKTKLGLLQNVSGKDLELKKPELTVRK